MNTPSDTGPVDLSPAELIRIKRDGGSLSPEQLQAFVAGVAGELVGDAQLGAFLMAAFLKGLSDAEQAALTLAMRDSGEVLRWDELDGPILDKHSTGGVGDLVSLVLAPLVAACGGYVPMISGRGLGHTGGTLDKLESIPGFDVNPARDRFRRTVREAGFAMIGQGARLAPADRRFYAVRDVTATVDCRPLIVSSILSKKLAEGLDGLVMDIKTGNGAILVDAHAARELGQSLCEVAAAAGLRCTALLTDMNQPLARSAGNALEMGEALAFLRGERPQPRLAEVVYGLCRELLSTGGIEADPERAQDLLRRAIETGAAAERFGRMVALQGGPADLVERPARYLAEAPVRRTVTAERDAFLVGVDTRAVGLVVHALGGGRERLEDAIDPSVGVSGLRTVGEWVEADEPLCEIHAATADDAEDAERRFRAALTFDDVPPERLRAAVFDRLAPGGDGRSVGNEEVP